MEVLRRFRDAVSGRYVARAQAAASPATSVAESDRGVNLAARHLVRAYDLDDTGRTSALASQFEQLRSALGMPTPGQSRHR